MNGTTEWKYSMPTKNNHPKTKNLRFYNTQRVVHTQ